jgi:uncharacterized membrane protein YbhN (UPF0104 family)
MADRATWHRVALLVAALFFAGGLAWSVRAFPASLTELRLVPMLGVVLLGVPLTILLNAAEFIATADYTRRRSTWAGAVEVTIIATAANMLPLPGGTIARVAALRSLGASVRDGVRINLLAAVIWAAIALMYSGAWMLASGHKHYGLAFGSVGAVSFLPTLAYIARTAGSWNLALKFVFIRSSMLILDSVHLLLCLWALGVSASFAQAASLALSGVAGSAVSIVPAGLGVREAVAGALASAVGLSLSAGFLAAALNRMLGLITVLPVAAWLTHGSRGTGVAADRQ